MSSEQGRYVVRRFDWRQPEPGRFVRMPGAVTVAEFDTPEAAEADRREREAAVRAKVNPFRCGRFPHDLTSLPEFVLLDWVQDAGLDPPRPDSTARRDWAKWWDKGLPYWTDDQRAKMWEALTRVRFFEAVTRPVGSVAYAVVRVMWEYNDNWMEPGQEGGEPVKAFRRRADAEAYRELLDEQERAQFPADTEGYQVIWYELDRWHDPFDPLPIEDGHRRYDVVTGRQARFYEVVEIDLGASGEGRA